MHAGTDLQQIQANLENISIPVREKLNRGPMGVGLWIPDEAASELSSGTAAEEFGDWLHQRDLVPFTINGFPFGNFHQPVVKQRVYEPAWWDNARRDYTLRLANIMDRILPANAPGSISTLPLGWGNPEATDDQITAAVANLKTVGKFLEELESESGRRICIAIEPEPGCILDTTEDMVGFFNRYLPEANLRPYLTVCHDICHAAVMYEDQSEVLKQYADAGIAIGKVQVSSAISVDWTSMNEEVMSKAIEQLRQFAEDRYLHQTSVKSQNGKTRLVDDLPQLLESVESSVSDESWRIHFHVPIYLDSFGELNGTRDAVSECLRSLQSTENLNFTGHLEAETYAWGVLPMELRTESLADGIAHELQWLHEQITQGE